MICDIEAFKSNFEEIARTIRGHSKNLKVVEKTYETFEAMAQSLRDSKKYEVDMEKALEDGFKDVVDVYKISDISSCLALLGLRLKSFESVAAGESILAALFKKPEK